MFSSVPTSFLASNNSQDTKQHSNLSFGNLNLSTDAFQNSNVFSSCMPTLNMVFGQDVVQPAKNQLVDSNLMFDFRQNKGNNISAQPMLPSSTILPKSEPESEQEMPSESSNLLTHMSNYTKALNSSLFTAIINREICHNPIIKQFSHSLLSSDCHHIYGILNTTTGVILLTIDIAHGNQLTKQKLDISDYITDVIVDPFDDNLILFSQQSTTLYIMNRFTKQAIRSYPHIIAYYPYYSHLQRMTYLFLLTVSEATAGIGINIVDMKAFNIHQCPTLIFSFDSLDRDIRKLLNDDVYSFSTVDIMRAYLCPFGASIDTCADTPVSGQIHQQQSFQFEETVFYVALDIVTPSNKAILVHSIVGPILLEPINQRIHSLSKIKASDSIKMISSDNFSVDFYLVKPIQSLLISDKGAAHIIGITPVVVCSSDDDVYSHYFLYICWGGVKMSTSLYELSGAEMFLYECDIPITISLQDAVFTHKDEGVCIYYLTALRSEPFNTNGVGAKVISLGTKTTDDMVHEFKQTVLDVASASLEETTFTMQGDSPIILGYDHSHQYCLCTSSTYKTVSILYRTCKPAINHDFILSKGIDPLLLSQLSSQRPTTTTTLQSCTQWLSKLSTNKLFDDVLGYLKTTPITQMDPDVLSAKLKYLNEAIIAVLSYSFSGETSPIKALLKETEDLLHKALKNTDLLLQSMHQIGMNLTQLSREYILRNKPDSISVSNTDTTMSSYF